MKKFEWKQLNGEVWIISCNENDGTIIVTDKLTDKLIAKYCNLSKDVIKVVMDNFLQLVTDSCAESNYNKNNDVNFNPMYV